MTKLLCFLLLPFGYWALSHAWEKQLSSRTCYFLDRCFLFLFALPFLPWPSLSSAPQAKEALFVSSQTPALSVPMRDYALSLSPASPALSLPSLQMLWAIGAVLFGLYLLYGAWTLQKIKGRSVPLRDRAKQMLFDQCKTKLGQTRGRLLVSSQIHTPLSFGLLTPVVLLPASYADWEEEALSAVFLHELQHQKQHDAWWNLLFCLVRLCFWFHPCLYFYGRSFRLHRELACDEGVLLLLPRQRQLSYGYTLLRCASAPWANPLVCSWGSQKKPLAKRIVAIAAGPKKQTRKALFFACFAFVLLSFTAGATWTAAAYPLLPKHKSSAPSHQVLDKSASFGSFTGSFVLYDVTRDQYAIYDNADATTPLLPASTYKPFSALCALEEGIITPEASTLLWDGTDYPFASWEQDQTMESALQQSVNWYFQALDAQVGRPTLSQWFRSIGYGNATLGSDLSTYWLDGSLLISPLQQAQLMGKLATQSLPCSSQSQEAVKHALLLSDDGTTRLYGKTGTTNGALEEGLFVGFLTTPSGVYSFATHIEGTNAAGSTAVSLTIQLLQEEGLLTP